MPALGIEQSETFWYKIQQMKLENVIVLLLEKGRQSEAATLSLVWELLRFFKLTEVTSFRYLQDMELHLFLQISYWFVCVSLI